MRCRTLTSLFLLALFLTIDTSCQTSKSLEEKAAAPRLAVLLVIDQMRPDYLSVNDKFYTGGFRTLLDSGAVYLNSFHNHAMTATAPGHSTISTGCFPSHHGIVANDIFDRTLWRRTNAVVDSSSKLVPYGTGQPASPHRLLKTTLGEWLTQASPQSKSFSVSVKDRSAILMAGKHANGVFWYDDEAGNFVTSAYYAQTIPDWASRFNQSRVVEQYNDSLWKKVGPDSLYALHGKDTVESEFDSLRSMMPHDYYQRKGIDTPDYDSLPVSPFGDEFTLQFAESLVVNEMLGADSIPDLLTVSLSCADITGHDFGPDSHEMADFYFRLDAYIGAFLGFLDSHVGKGKYVLALTADHGVLPLPELLRDSGIDSRRVSKTEYKAAIDSAFASIDFKTLGCEPIPWSFSGNDIVFDTAGLAKCKKGPGEIRSVYAKALRSVAYLSDVYTYDDLLDSLTPDRQYLTLFRNSFHPERAPDLIVQVKEHYLMTSSKYGTSHLTPYRYDTDVPIVFYGAAIKSGRHDDRLMTVQIAPTLAALLGVTPTDSIDGSPVAEITNLSQSR